jgi:hypothetical protein
MKMRESILLLSSVVFAVCASASVGTASVSLLSDPTLITGGSDTKFSCLDACSTSQGNTGGACIATSTGGPIQCGTTNPGTVCGEQRKNQQVRSKCVVDPAGVKNPCSNDNAAAHCYEYKWCKCSASKCSTVAGAGGWMNFGSEVSSTNCP